MTQLDNAQQLDQWGFNVFPAAYAGKLPTVQWKQYQTVRTSDRLTQWFNTPRPVNYWVACGRVSGIVVLDIDSDGAEQYWRERIGDTMETTACVQTAKGHHYYYRIDNDDPVASWSHHDADTALSWDVRADGTGVIAPPSVHANGHTYTWIRTPEHLEPLPDILRGPSTTNPSTGETNTRSILAKLLGEPPTKGGRNIWMSRVAGHYAKQYRTMGDAYRVQCEIANHLLPEPLTPAEFDKTITSIWDTEQQKDAEQLNQADEDNGYLISGQDRLLAPVMIKEEEGWRIELRQWANFDLRTVGVVEDDDAARTYDIEIHRKRQNDVRTDLLPATTLADNRKLAAWLAGHGVNITQPTEREQCKMPPSARLQSYLEAQKPPHFKVVQALGWDGAGFICHEGVVRSDGLHGYAGTKPDPMLRKRGEWRYGFVEPGDARAILQEVLTFHHEHVAAVFGAWWAACLLKPQLQQVSSQFPFMALEAPSESGKTTGMFSKLIQLAGNGQGQTSYTMASMRNAIAAHHSGIVWVDDEDSLDHLTQLLRIATGEGSYTKMAEDHSTSVTVKLVSPILLSGEALQMGSQKALKDRAVMLEVPSPTDRRSVHNPNRPQWDDIVNLTVKHPDLTTMAGNMVQMALQHGDQVKLLGELRGDTAKRYGDKMAILQVGARVLAGMTDQPHWIELVDRWVDDQIDTGAENALTLKILPTALQIMGWPDRVFGPERDMPPTPVFTRPAGQPLDGVWFSVNHLALWWSRYKQGRIEQRTESREALEQQARALGLPQQVKRIKIQGHANIRPSYWRLPDDVAARVLQRAQGDPDGYTEQLHP